MSRISFPCQNPNPCPKTFSVSVEHVGRSANCPICGFQNTVLSAETIALNNELSKIESELAECENKIKDGRLSVAVVKRRIQGIADPNEIMAWINAGNVEKIEAYKKATLLAGEINTIDIKRLSELGHQYPNNSRVIQLGNRAADCHLELSKINLTASEELGGPDSSVLLNGTKDLLSTMFPHWRPKSSVPPVISRPVAEPIPTPSPPVPSTRTSSVSAPVSAPHYIRRNRQVAHGEMGCYHHPSQRAVAHCAKCGKPICRYCAEDYGVAIGEYAGKVLCYDCTAGLVAANVTEVNLIRKQTGSAFNILGIVGGFVKEVLLAFGKCIEGGADCGVRGNPAGIGKMIGGMIRIILAPITAVLRFIGRYQRLKQLDKIIASDSDALQQMQDYFAYTQALEENESVDLTTFATDNAYANAVLSKGEQAAQTELRRGVAQIAANGEIIKRYNVA